MLKNKSIDYIFGMITGVLLVFIISCNQPQTKTVDEKVEYIKNLASKVGIEHKIHIHRTTVYDCNLRQHPNSPELNVTLIRIPKGTEVEILGEMQDNVMKPNTWYKVTYKGKTGWVSEHNF